MTGRTRLILTLHNHQPIGNFGGVFEAAYQDSYLPFLNLLQEFPDLPVVLHLSGCLLEWLVEQHPEYVDRVRTLVERGQIELLGGPYYEPILACIPRRDRIGQMRVYKRYLEQTFNTTIRGLWVPERVWEQGFVGDIAAAGLEYTLLDDSHFRMAGLGDRSLHGYYLTEDGGALTKVFAGSERLRYLIPYHDPQAIIDYCRHIGQQHPGATLVFGDDGEKFGVWPGSQQHVFTHGWLRRFFEALRQNLDWLQVTTMAEAVDHVAPLGSVYLPDASYREMTEWALPAPQQIQLKQATEHFQHQEQWSKLQPFVRAGSWRNFLVKYPEAREMYARMQQVSNKLHLACEGDTQTEQRTVLADARRELYRAQCNCAYWHGAFGGLYLPHLRHAIYGKLIAADSLIDLASRRGQHWVHAEAADFNLDARQEVCLSSERVAAFFSPAQGGHLYELDVRPVRVNLLGTLNRQFETYHDTIRNRAHEATHGSEHGGGVDPNGGIRFKQAGLDRQIVYDHWPRKSLVDHFLQPGVSQASFEAGTGGVGDFATGVYQAAIRRRDGQVEVRQSREGLLGPYRVSVTKTVALDQQNPSVISVGYTLEQLPPGLPIHFGVEWNFAGLAAGASDRYFYNAAGQTLGSLDSRYSLPATKRLGLVDEWLGLDVALEFGDVAAIWTMPVQTVSQSESGFELVHQSTCVVPRWEFVASAEGTWSTQMTLTLDTSAAQARQLSETTLFEPVDVLLPT